ncbi:MAG: shikimate dehydrogenase [Armatimonadota bacterium]
MFVSGKTKVLGVFGHPVGHSLSPVMHNAVIESLGLNYVYVPFDVTPENLTQALCGVCALGVSGVNVTIPHKEAVIELLDEVAGDAREVGSVNTIVNIDGRLTGMSTDGAGFLRSLEESGFSPEGKTAVVLGAGGSGRAVTFALAKAGAEVTVFSRSLTKAERLAEDIRSLGRECGAGDISRLQTLCSGLEADLLVNCTPVGMYPDIGKTPVPAEALRRGMVVYDLVYNPVKTALLEAAEAAGAQTVNGLDMLVYQGALSFKIWTGIEPLIHTMKAALMKRLGSSSR